MRILALDIRPSSIGFALVEHDLSLGKGSIEKMGVHLFDKAEDSKTGDSLSYVRNCIKQQRKSIRRRAGRLRAIRSLFELYNLEFLPANRPSQGSFDAQDQVNRKSVEFLNDTSPWQLRSQALERKLERKELAVVLYHIAKHRGFQLSKKDEATLTRFNTGKMVNGALQNEMNLKASIYPTIGAYFYAEKLQRGEKVRNENLGYQNTISRRLNEDEARYILDIQRNVYSQHWINTQFIEEYCHIAFTQKPKKSIENSVGLCPLEKLKGNSIYRAPRYSRSAELFILWQKINHLRIIRYAGQVDVLLPTERQKIYDLAHTKKLITYEDLRKCCNMASTDSFNIPIATGSKGWAANSVIESSCHSPAQSQMGVTQRISQTEQAIFIELKGYHALAKILGDDRNGYSWEVWDEVSKILSFEQSISTITSKLQQKKDEFNLRDVQIAELSKIQDFTGTIHISCKAIRAILPYLQTGIDYKKAILNAGYIESSRPNNKLAPFEKTNRPVINRALAQARKVINAVLREYGMPDSIHIELARELTQSFQERQNYSRRKENIRKFNAELRDNLIKTSGSSISTLKYKLWREQNQQCLLSGLPISIEELRDPAQTQIVLALPYARSFNHSYFNQLLAKTSESQMKGQLTIAEYFQKRKLSEDWERLLQAVSGFYPLKRSYILTQDFSKKEKAWRLQNFHNQNWLAAMIKNHFGASFNLPCNHSKKIDVIVINGKITAYLRKQWQLQGDLSKSFKHLAQYAAVIAVTSPQMVQKVAKYNVELRRAKPQPVSIPLPWGSFRRHVKSQTETILVHRQPKRSATGEIAGANPSRLILQPATHKKVVVERIQLQALQPKKLENLIDKESCNYRLYNILCNRLKEHDNDPGKAFQEAVYLNSTNKSTLVKQVSVYGRVESGRFIRGGLVSNGSQVRVDIFQKGSHFYLCPVYAWHFKVGQIPNQVMVSNKGINEWPTIDETFHYIFTLYPNDYVRIVQRNGQVFEGYYVSSVISLAQIVLRSHDGSPIYPQADKQVNTRSFGVFHLQSMIKYQIDYFGNKFPVRENKRPIIKKIP